MSGVADLRALLPTALEPSVQLAYRAVWRVVSPLLSDRRFDQLQYLAQFGRLPDLAAPSTFNEKVLWRKLYDHRPLFTKLCDRVAVREYVAERVGAEHLVETYGVFDEPEGIPWADLPGPCVVKATHGSGWYHVVRDPARVDGRAMAPELQRWLRSDYSNRCRERQYAGVPPRIVIERMLQVNGTLPVEYKAFCFDGRPQLLQCTRVCPTRLRFISFYDTSWRPVPMVWNARPGPAETRPEALDELLRVASRLSADLDFVRVDLYEVDGHVYFGELTLTPNAGLLPIYPREIDARLGNLWRLPKTRDAD